MCNIDAQSYISIIKGSKQRRSEASKNKAINKRVPNISIN